MVLLCLSVLNHFYQIPYPYPYKQTMAPKDLAYLRVSLIPCSPGYHAGSIIMFDPRMILHFVIPTSRSR